MKKNNLKIKRKMSKNILFKIILALILVLIVLFVILLDIFIYPIHKFWITILTPKYPARAEDALRVHFIDVGQGDSTIIEFPDNKKMIIDGGNDSIEVKNTVLQYTASLNIKKFDYIVATHSDTDHVGALDDVIQIYDSEEIYMPYVEQVDKNVAYASFYQAAQNSNAKKSITQMTQNFTSSNDNFYYMLCLSPLGPHAENSFYHSADSNDSSAVLYLEYAGHNLLLTGDASTKVEKFCIDSYNNGIYNNVVELPNGDTTFKFNPKLENVSFYKAGHHGSNTSSSQEWINLIQPKEVFISCGAGNSYGHPHKDVLDRLNKANANIHRTDMSRNIVLTIYKDGRYTIDYH